MAGDFCREAAVLIFVFGNLDIWLKSLTGELEKRVFEGSGMLFERWSQK